MSTPPTGAVRPPNFSSASETVTEPGQLAGGSSTESISRDYLELPSGKELKEADAVALAERRPAQLIVLAGPTDSGKTTLVTTLYELFQWREVEGYAFAGSDTLPAFEERCFLSRRASGRRIPHTQRTPYQGPDPSYLHLRVRGTGGLRWFRDLLFTDVSGEMFEHARDSTDECKELTFLKRANHLLLLLDSAKGIDPLRRWAMIEDGRSLLRSMVDSGMLGKHCAVNIVWARFDYFAAAEADEEHRLFRTQVERELRDLFVDHVSSLNFSEVAARPLQKSSLGFGYGVSALLKQWVEAPLRRTGLDLFPTVFSGTRESELFAMRHFASVKLNEQSAE